MPAPIVFYFDFSSPYGYLAAQRIDALGAKHGRDVVWKPFLLGVVFKITGMRALMGIPIKGDYALEDMRRSARQIGVPFEMPAQFPFMSVAASRAFYWLTDSDPEQAKTLAKALYHRTFGEGGDIAAAAAVVQVATEIGLDEAALLSALKEKSVKERLRSEVDTAIEKGVFGSPFIVVDGEQFWGYDKLHEVDQWLETGGW